MNVTEQVRELNETICKLQEENRKLEQDRDQLLEILAQLKVSLNRLIKRYITDQQTE